jgi:hypothetical protein
MLLICNVLFPSAAGCTGRDCDGLAEVACICFLAMVYWENGEFFFFGMGYWGGFCLSAVYLGFSHPIPLSNSVDAPIRGLVVCCLVGEKFGNLPE